MPLIKSKSDEARSENIRTEIVEGNKSPKQAAAIAYSVQRKSGGKDSKRGKDSKKAKDSKMAKDTTPPTQRAGHFLQAVDAIHECADNCMGVGYDRKRK